MAAWGPAAGWREPADVHDRALAHTRHALEVIMRPEIDLARLRCGRSESVGTSDIRQQTLRCPGQAGATAAHPILKDAGEILTGRLARQVPPDRAAS